MKGKHTFIVSNRFVKYEFTIKRNITIIQGDSATGKTTLLNMLEAYTIDPENSGVEVVCDVPVFVYRSVGAMLWNTILEANEGSVIFIEENYDFVSTSEFAEYLEHSDSYYVIITREDLENLPYSAEEIYRIKESGKYGTTSQVYNILEKIYRRVNNNSHDNLESGNISCIITEDSKAGFQFWDNLSKKVGKKCVSSYGKSNIAKYIKEYKNENLLLIVDGAAFGSQMRRVSKMIERKSHEITCEMFLPESFEWVLLKAGTVQDIPDLQNILENTYDYVESKEYMSWERFFTAFLIRESNGKPYQYNKKMINAYYISNKMIQKVRAEFPILERV